MSPSARCWYFNEKPSPNITDNTLILREVPQSPLEPGQLRIRSLYLSLDATNRVWLSDWDSYMDPVKLGDPMRGFIVGEVVESRNEQFPVGSLAAGLTIWSEMIVTDGAGWQPFPKIPGLSIADTFGVLAVAGPTALIGLMDIGKPKAGETVVVTAAAGAVGMLVGQIAKLQGCRTVGVAGSEAKCRWLVEEMGYDAAINYKTENLVDALKAKAPNGVDVLFENVGGEVLDAGLTCMNNFGRVVICGLISMYNTTEPVPGPYMFRNLIFKRLTVQGFVILDYVDQYPAAQQQLAQWMLEGKLRYKLHVVDGIENAREALKMLYSGANDGKLMVRMGAEPA